MVENDLNAVKDTALPKKTQSYSVQSGSETSIHIKRDDSREINLHGPVKRWYRSISHSRYIASTFRKRI